jgi:hypothetical protein
LYDREVDIGKTRNLAAAELKTAAAPRAELERLNAQMAAPLW